MSVQESVPWRKFNLVWLSLAYLASLSPTLVILDNWFHEAGYQMALLSLRFLSSYECVHVKNYKLLTGGTIRTMMPLFNQISSGSWTVPFRILGTVVLSSEPAFPPEPF